jgi:hypothetical protein
MGVMVTHGGRFVWDTCGCPVELLLIEIRTCGPESHQTMWGDACQAKALRYMRERGDPVRQRGSAEKRSQQEMNPRGGVFDS